VQVIHLQLVHLKEIMEEQEVDLHNWSGGGGGGGAAVAGNLMLPVSYWWTRWKWSNKFNHRTSPVTRAGGGGGGDIIQLVGSGGLVVVVMVDQV
jgi:murein DD-endopeptidase MepM/ murein hydrolase activator NlpD